MPHLIPTHPASIYLATLGAGSQHGTRQALNAIAGYLSGGEHDHESFPWEEVRYQHTAAVRTHLVDRYQPSTVNRFLSALRGVLKETWRLGLVDAETYHRAVDVPNVRGSVLPRGRALDADELSALFGACADDPSPAGRRDAAMLAVFYGTGMRRGELIGLDLDDVDLDDGSIRVRHAKRSQQRTVYLNDEGCRLVDAWIAERGDADGPLFGPVRQSGEIKLTRLSGESISYILRKRQKQAEVEPTSPHDLRRTFVTTLLDRGVDIFTVQQLAGHADASTTARYDRRDESAKRSAVQALLLPTEGRPIATAGINSRTPQPKVSL